MASIPSPLATGCGFHLFAMIIGCPFWVCVALGGLAFALAPRVKQ